MFTKEVLPFLNKHGNFEFKVMDVLQIKIRVG